MSGRDSGDDRSPADSARRPHALTRRTLLQTALVAPAALPLARETAAQGTPGAGSGTGGGGGGGAHATPDAHAAPPAPQPTPINPDAPETWLEPWVWRPGDWPGQQLELNVVENENPGDIVGYGNPSAVLFSYNGATPGPTIRMRGDEILLLRLRNMLGLNHGSTYVGPYPDPKELPKNINPQDVNKKAQELGNFHHDYCLGEHTNGTHAVRTTNIHTHGLHVRPGRNPDGTHSDNVILRLIDSEDLEMREAHADSPGCSWLRDPNQVGYLRDADEIVGYAEYEFHVGNVQAESRENRDLPPQPHPPGTHWYHPHCHGATHNQVASGMAGFLIIEGDVDTAVNLALTGDRRPDLTFKTGPYDYRERLMLIQRVFLTSSDPDAHTQDLKPGGGGGGTTADVAINGDSTPMVINMRPGAIERWRVLNGSADGQAFQHVMVLKGQYAVLVTSTQNGTVNTLVKQQGDSGTFAPASRAEVEADKQHLYQLAFDGVTLVAGDAESATYTIQDLAEQNPGTESPLNRDLTGNPNQAMLANYEACFADADSVRNAYVRPNEVYMGPGNRTDLFFQAPGLDGAAAQIYSVVSRGAVLHSDTFQAGLQGSITDETYTSDPQDIVVAYVIVAVEEDADGNPLPAIDDFDVMDLIGVLPPVPDYLFPIPDDELRVGNRAAGTGATPTAEGSDRYRTRTITYSGWGANDYPLVTTEGDSETARNFRAFVERDQANGGTLELLRYAKIADSDEYVLLSPNVRSMAISGSASTEVIDDSDPLFPITANMARKFSPDDHMRPQVLVDTAEEWALYNVSNSLWADTSQTPLGQQGGHYPGLPLTRAEGQARFAQDPSWRLQTKGVDHPFHMHQNPYWVMRVEVPDENGNLVNILSTPRWQDVVWIPRNGGRVVFRARFPDYVGIMVNHCHILLHEDHGMMQAVEITPFANQASFEAKDRVTALDDSAEAVSEIYPPYDPVSGWRQSMQFIDPNHDTGQTFPGFVLGDPPTG
jgi:FtsP/CotA-like multicopper oxidase with cupredoxin domain